MVLVGILQMELLLLQKHQSILIIVPLLLLNLNSRIKLLEHYLGDNTFDGNQRIFLVLVLELKLAFLQKHVYKMCPGIMLVQLVGLILILVEKMPPSFHYKQRLYTLIHLLYFLNDNAILLALKFVGLIKDLDKILHLNIRPLNSQNLSDFLKLLDTWFYQKMSMRLKMFVGNLLIILRMVLLLDIFLIRLIRNVR